jgi:hypothetical protein
MSSATISGDDIVLSASGVIMAATSLGFEIAGTSKLAITASGIKLDATVTLDDDGTIADASNIMTVTQNTIKLVGDTAITLDGDTALDGTHTFTTGTGNVTVKGDMSIDAGKDFDMSAGAGTFATGTGAVSLAGNVGLATTKSYTSGTASAIGGTHIIYQDGASAKSFEVIPGTSIDLNETNITLTGAIKLDGEITLDDDGTIGDVSDVMTLTQDSIILSGAVKLDGTVTLDDDGTIEDASNVTTLTQDTITLAGATKINLDGPVDLTGKLALDAQAGTASVSGLLMGIGTAGDPATDGTSDSKFIELRCETTATSGDCRLQYMRYYMAGINATGGECLKAGTVLEAAIGTARGGQASIEVSSVGYVSGFACGWDALLEVTNSAVHAGGTYCAGQSQVWMTGSSSDLSAAAAHSIHRFSVTGGSAVAEAKVLNAFDFDVVNCADSGGAEMISPGTNEGATTGTIRILINGDIRYLAYYSHRGHA